MLKSVKTTIGIKKMTEKPLLLMPLLHLVHCRPRSEYFFFSQQQLFAEPSSVANLPLSPSPLAIFMRKMAKRLALIPNFSTFKSQFVSIKNLFLRFFKKAKKSRIFQDQIQLSRFRNLLSFVQKITEIAKCKDSYFRKS